MYREKDKNGTTSMEYDFTVFYYLHKVLTRSTFWRSYEMYDLQ